MAFPEIVSAEKWQVARDDLLAAEKQATRALDALAARRRRLPMVAFPQPYTFESPTGPLTLLELFDGRDELLVYYQPKVELKTENGSTYEWPGGVGAQRGIVAYSAICSHRLTYPTRQISFISYRDRTSASRSIAWGRA